MRTITRGLYVGAETDCRAGSDEMAVVHACKTPCHMRAVGYTGKIASDHPDYLSKADDYNLYLNIIDPPVPLFKIETFRIALSFMRKHSEHGRPILVHCNQGLSRAPTLALLYWIALEASPIPESFAAARKGLGSDFEWYAPGAGLVTFLTVHWNEIWESAP